MTVVRPRFCTSFTVGGTTYRHSTEDFYDSGDNFYSGTLKEYPDLRYRLQERTWGTYERETARLIYSNSDNAWNTLLAAQELRDVDITFSYYDAEAGGAPVAQVIGQIVSVDAREQTTVLVELRRFDILETIIPTKVVDTAEFPKATDLGAAINIVSGEAKAVPLRYIHHDYDNDYYDYLICEPGTNQTLESVDVVYREGRTVSPAEYDVYDGTQGAPHGGYAFIRFAKEQKDFDERLHSLTADVTMGSQDFADFIKEILTESAWGLGESINAASFAAATAALAVIGDMNCDGAVTVQSRARDIIEDLLDKCWGHLYQNTSSEWVLEIDATHDNSPVATFGFNDGYYNNILEIKDNTSTPSDRALKSITLQYGRQADGSKLIYENTRSVFSFGRDEIVRTNFINDHITADKYTCRRKNLAIYSDNGMTIVVGEDGRDLAIKDVITLEIPDWSINSARYRIEDIIEGESTFKLVIKEYVSDIYGYAEGDIPDSADSAIGTMWGVGDVQLPSDETLIAHWGFDLGQGYAIAIDLSGYGHHGELVNRPNVIYGVSGKALDFDDDDSEYMTVPDSDTLDDLACISCWVNPQTYHAAEGEDLHIIVSKHASCNFGLYMDYSENPNEFVAVFEDSNGLTSEARCAVFDTYGQWFHIVAQVNPTLNGAEIFVNGGRMDYDAAGALVDIDGNGTDKSDAPVLIAGGLADRYSRIAVDRVKLFDSNLEPWEIRALWLERGGESSYTEELALIQGGASVPHDTELVGYWDCNDVGLSTTLKDNSGHGQDLTGSAITFVDGISGDGIDGNHALTGTPATALADAIKSGDFSISFWWTPKEELDSARFISFDTNAGANTVFIQHQNDNSSYATLAFGYYKDASNHFYGYITTAQAIFLYNTTYHVICVHDRTNDLLKLYVDGVEYPFTMLSAGDGASGFPIFTTCTEISLFPAANLDDEIDQIRIYNKVLEDSPNPGSEIQGLYKIPAGNPPQYAPINLDKVVSGAMGSNAVIDKDNDTITINANNTFFVNAGGRLIFLGDETPTPNLGNMYHTGDSLLITWTSASEWLQLEFDLDDVCIYFQGDFIPASDNTYDIGTVDNSVQAIYSYAYYDDGGNPIDDEPDLAILDSLWENAIEIDGKKKHNLLAAPDFLTDKAKLREKAKKEKGISSEEEFEKLLRDPNEPKYNPKRNISTNLDLVQGSVRELKRIFYKEISTLRSEIQNLKKQIGG